MYNPYNVVEARCSPQLEKDTRASKWAIISMTTNNTMLLVAPVLSPAAILDMDSSATFSPGATAAATPKEIKDIG